MVLDYSVLGKGFYFLLTDSTFPLTCPIFNAVNDTITASVYTGDANPIHSVKYFILVAYKSNAFT